MFDQEHDPFGCLSILTEVSTQTLLKGHKTKVTHHGAPFRQIEFVFGGRTINIPSRVA